MTRFIEKPGGDELIDVRHAAALAGRHPETVRRWVWSGRLAARRQGRRLLIERGDLEAVADVTGRVAPSLASWAERAQAALASGTDGARRSAADLVVEDRARRSDGTDAGR